MTDTTYQNFIDNTFVPSEALIEVYNPANAELLGRVDCPPKVGHQSDPWGIYG